MPTFGDNVRAALARAEKTAVWLAGQLHISSQQADRYAHPDYDNPTLETIFKIAKTLGVSVESLCERIDVKYDAMRIAAPDEAALLELWRRMTDDQRAACWPMLRMAAQAPIAPAPAVTAPDPATPPPPGNRPSGEGRASDADDRERLTRA